MNRSLLLLFLILNLPVARAENLRSLEIKLGEKLSIQRNVSELEKMRAAYLDQKYKDCYGYGARAEAKFADLRPWIRALRLQCGRLQLSRQAAFRSELASLVQKVWKDSENFVVGAHLRTLRAEIAESTLVLAENFVKSNRALAWDNMDLLFSTRDWLDSKQRARLYRAAGELSFAQQELVAARDYLERSLKEEPNSSVQARLDSISRKIDPKKTVEVPRDNGSKHLDVTPEELEIYNRMNTAIKGGDLLAGVEDGVKILREYPGGVRAQEAAKNVLSVYLGIAFKREEKYQILKDQVLEQMRKVDGQRMYDWAQTMTARERFTDALFLSQNSLEQIGGHPMSTKVLMLAAQAAHQAADFKKARDLYEKLVREHAGTKLAAEGLFRLGQLDIHDEKYAEAANRFERFLQLESNSDFELSSLYWLWRCRQKLNPEQANEAAEKLIARYPVSYFGLRARAELSANKLSLPKDVQRKLSWKFSLTASEEKSWNRFLLLNKAGWSEEAQAELSFLEEPSAPEGKLIYAQVVSDAGDFYRASDILYRTFMADPSLLALSTVKLAYPEAYVAEIKKEAARYKIPPQLVLALMKQESSFRAEVRSPAGALGLMQLMPVTAREVASDMRIRIKDLTKDLTTPAINIRIGTQYLHRRLRAFDGHVPLALAAYNAGIGNIRNWLSSRQDMKDLQKQSSSNPFDELWIDELPWSETTGYIKSILRNYLVYKILDQGEYEVPSPVWKMTEEKV